MEEGKGKTTNTISMRAMSIRDGPPIRHRPHPTGAKMRAHTE